MDINKLGSVICTLADIRARVVHTNWSDEQVGHHAGMVWVFLNEYLREDQERIVSRNNSNLLMWNFKETLSTTLITSLSSLDGNASVLAFIILLPFSHFPGWELSLFLQRSSKGWPALTVTLETSSSLLIPVSMSETQSITSSHTKNDSHVLFSLFTLSNYFCPTIRELIIDRSWAGCISWTCWNI